MKHTTSVRIVMLFIVLLTTSILSFDNHFVAIGHSQSKSLEGTTWRGIVDVGKVSDADSVRTEFTYLFQRDGKVKVDSFNIISGYEIKQRRNPVTGEWERWNEAPPVWDPHKSTTKTSEICTYKQRGNLVNIKCNGIDVNATIQNNKMDAEINIPTFGKKVKWLIERVSEGNNGSSELATVMPPSSDKVNNSKGIDYVAILEGTTPFDEAESLRKAKQYREAIKKYTQTLEIDPSKFEAKLYRGDCKLELQDYKGAIVDYDQFFKFINGLPAGTLDHFPELKPLVAHAYYNRGIAKEKVGDKIGACADFRKSCDSGNSIACKNAKSICN